MIHKAGRVIAVIYRIIVSGMFLWIWYKTYEKYEKIDDRMS